MEWKKESQMKVYLIRHGETDLNKQKRLQGKMDIELNEYGRKLARMTAEGLKSVEFHLAFTSPLKRAKETAQIIIGDRKIPLIEEPRIAEIGFGIYEGHCYEGENRDIKDDGFINFFQHPEKYCPPQNGETFEEIIRRTGEFWNELMGNQEYDNKTILIATHGCALKAILANANDIPVADIWGKSLNKNCGVTILDVQSGQVNMEEDGKIFY